MIRLEMVLKERKYYIFSWEEVAVLQEELKIKQRLINGKSGVTVEWLIQHECLNFWVLRMSHVTFIECQDHPWWQMQTRSLWATWASHLTFLIAVMAVELWWIIWHTSKELAVHKADSYNCREISWTQESRSWRSQIIHKIIEYIAISFKINTIKGGGVGEHVYSFLSGIVQPGYLNDAKQHKIKPMEFS